MRGYYILSAMSIAIILVARRLVSKRHHCEKITTLFWFMLVFMCAIRWQIAGEINQAVQIFWLIALVLGGGVLVADSSSAKTYYYLKDFQVQNDEHRLALEREMRLFAETHLPKEAALKMDYRLIIMEKMSARQEKACLQVINDYINEHDCSDNKDWRWMILFAATLQLMAVLAMLAYHLFFG